LILFIVCVGLTNGSIDEKSIYCIDRGVNYVTNDNKEEVEVLDLVPLEVEICLTKRMLQDCMKLTMK